MPAQTNPLRQVPVTLAAPDADGRVGISVGPNAWRVPLALLQQLYDDRDEASLLRFLVLQMGVVLQQAGVDPRTATHAQIAAAVQAKTYWA